MQFEPQCKQQDIHNWQHEMTRLGQKSVTEKDYNAVCVDSKQLQLMSLHKKVPFLTKVKSLT